jgi:hypothetical protein
MKTSWLTMLWVVALGASLSADITIVEEDFRSGQGASWYYAGTGTYVADAGAVLVDTEQRAAGTVSYGERIQARALRIRLAFTLETGTHGFGDGLAVGLVATPTPEILGAGEGLFGLGNLPSCAAALLVEFDFVANDPGDFGPMGAALVHTGVAYAATDSITGDASVPTLAAGDIAWLSTGGERVSLTAEIHVHENRITVCCGPEDGDLTRVVEHELSDFDPFEGFLTFGAANGALAGRATVLSVSVAQDTLPPPRLGGAATNDGVQLTWEAPAGLHDSYVVLRDGTELHVLSGEDRTYLDPDPSPGRHVYELVARAHGTEAPPTGLTVYVDRPFLVVDAATPGAEPSPHARAWLEGLSATGRTAARVTAIDEVALDQFEAVMWINGSGRAQRPMSAATGQRLCDYVAGQPGARLYLEGPDLWAFLPRGALAARDGVAGVRDGWPATEIEHRDLGIVHYDGQSCALDELAPAPDEGAYHATELWRRAEDGSESGGDGQPALALALRSEADRAVLIATSVELYRLADPEDRAAALAEYLSFLELPYADPVFRRGDAQPDGLVTIGDAIYLLGYLFAGSPPPTCMDAADTNDDGKFDISDPIAILIYLFRTGPLPLPGAACGTDPTPDELPPCSYPACP